MSLIPSRHSARKSATKSKSLKIQIDNRPTDHSVVEIPDEVPTEVEAVNNSTQPVDLHNCPGQGKETSDAAELTEEVAESNLVPDAADSPGLQEETLEPIELIDHLEHVAPDLPVNSPLPTTGLPSNYEGQLLPLHPPVIIEGRLVLSFYFIQC